MPRHLLRTAVTYGFYPLTMMASLLASWTLLERDAPGWLVVSAVPALRCRLNACFVHGISRQDRSSNNRTSLPDPMLQGKIDVGSTK